MRKVSEPFRRKDRPGWWIRWFNGGQKHHKSFRTKTEAALYRNLLYQELNRDVFQAIQIPFGQARDRFLDYCAASNLARSSVNEYKYTFRQFADCCPEVCQSSDLTSAAVSRFVTERLAVVAPYTVKKQIVQLKTVHKWLDDNGFAVGRVVWPKIRPRATKPKRTLDRDQVPVILGRCRDEKEKLAFLSLLCSGLRAGDLDCVTRWTDATLSGDQIKTGRPFSVPIPQKLADRLDRSRVESLKIGRKRWEAILDGICTRHDLRRTFASWLAAVDNTDLASGLLGHTNTRVTKEFYLVNIQRILVERAFSDLC